MFDLICYYSAIVCDFYNEYLNKVTVIDLFLHSELHGLLSYAVV